MKKIVLFALTATLFTACKDGKAKKEKPTTTTTEATTPAPAATGKDAELTKWLGGKILVSTYDEPKYDIWNNLKLNADGTCTDKDNAAATWSVSGGEFVFKSVIDMKMVIEKRAEDTLVFKSEYGKDGVYVLKAIN